MCYLFYTFNVNKQTSHTLYDKSLFTFFKFFEKITIKSQIVFPNIKKMGEGRK